MRLLAMCLFGLVLYQGQASATTIVSMNFNEITQTADGILAGTVTDITSRRAEDGIIYSFVTLGDLEVLGGRYTGETFTLRIEGGQVGGEVQEVVGAPNFREGERVIVFVDDNGERIVPIAGWQQGLFRIVSDPQTGAEYVVDAVGNRVYGVREGEVIKETRFGTEAELFGQGSGVGPDASAESEPPMVDFGQTNGGRLVRPGDAGTERAPMVELQAAVGEPLTYEAFRGLIGAQMEAAGVGEMETLTSVSPDELPQGRFEDAAPATTPAVDEALEQAPADRGSAPRPIEPGERPDLDAEE